MAKDGSGCLGATLIGGVIFVILLICGIYVWRSYNKIVEADQLKPLRATQLTSREL